MPPRFSSNIDLTSSVNALSNQTWFKHFCGWWTAQLPHKIGGQTKKPLLFCPHKNYPFKTFFFKKLETNKFPSVFGEHLIPINNTLFSLKKKATLHFKRGLPMARK